jgi:hypothetical protein
VSIPSPEELLTYETKVRSIFRECAKIFAERNGRYKNLFLQDGVVGSARHIRHKALRLAQKAEDFARYIENPEAYVRGYGDKAEPPTLDDAYDLINYCCFLIICATEGRWLTDEDNNEPAS